MKERAESCFLARELLPAVSTSKPFFPNHVFSMVAKVKSSSIMRIDGVIYFFLSGMLQIKKALLS